MGPTGTSALPQRLQLVGHLLQLPLNGQQALKLLVLGENSKSHGDWPRVPVPAARSRQPARLVVPLMSCVALDRWCCFSEP